MFFISNLCVLCLAYKNLKTTSSEDNEGIIIQNKLKYCLPEIVESHLDTPEYICINCLSKLDCFYKFKQWCIQNNTCLKNYVQDLKSVGETKKCLSVKLTDIKYLNKLEAEDKDQTLAIVASDDQLRIDEEEHCGTGDKEETKCADVSDFKESHQLFDVEKDEIVKEECIISENRDDIEFYDKFVNNIKHESMPSDSAVSMLENKNVHKDLSSNSENNATEPEKNQVKIIITGITAFSCSMCNKNFVSESNLTKHIKIFHNVVRNFECCVCHKKFAQIRRLYLHEKTHIGNFKCSLCNKKFKNKYNWISHEKYQYCVEKFECSVCNKKFSQKRHLIEHERMYKYDDFKI